MRISGGLSRKAVSFSEEEFSPNEGKEEVNLVIATIKQAKRYQ